MLSVLPAEIAALAPAALVLGFVLILLPFANRRSTLSRTIVFGAATLVGWRYLIWRFANTLPDPGASSLDHAIAWAFLALETGTVLSATVAAGIMSRTTSRSAEADLHANWWKDAPSPPRVHLLIPTYNEDAAVLERTIAGAVQVDHPGLKVWVLDDGRREWLSDMCRDLGANYLTRGDNAHAKAGNINAAVRHLEALEAPPDFVAVFDADFIPHRNFAARTLPLFHNPAVGIVQTPQIFFNADPIQHNLGITEAYPHEQHYFFHNVEPSRDGWGIAACCGTSALIRFSALQSVGGFPTDTVTEDAALTLRLREHGFDTVYLDEGLSEGLAAEGLGEFVSQRARWCLGSLQIARGALGPLARNKLRLIDRIGVLDSALYWSCTFTFRLACIAVPILYWWLGVVVLQASLTDAMAFFLPHIIASTAAMNWASRGLHVPIIHDAGQLIAAPAVSHAAIVGAIRAGDHKFRVTDKGGDRSQARMHWQLARLPLIALVLTTLGPLASPILFGSAFDNDSGDGRLLVLSWTLYNALALGLTVLLCHERPRSAATVQPEDEGATVTTSRASHSCWLTTLHPDRLRLRGLPALPNGVPCEVLIADVGAVEGYAFPSAVRGETDIRLRPTAAQRAAILVRMHTRTVPPVVNATRPVALMVSLARRIFSAKAPGDARTEA